MDSRKLIVVISIAVLAMAGCIGAAYAFSASLDNEDNSAAIAYWELSIDASSATDQENLYSNSLNATTPYDTITKFESGAEVVYLKWVGTLDEDILDLQLNPLGFMKVSAVKEDHETHVPDPESGHYMMTLTMSNAEAHQVNVKYDFYAGQVTLSSDGKSISQHATELYPFVRLGTQEEPGDDFVAQLPVVGIGAGYAFAVYAMPHALTNLASITDEGFATQKTDVLKNAKVEVKVSSDVKEDATLESIKVHRDMDKKSYVSTDGAWDLDGLVVFATYSDGSVQVVDQSDDDFSVKTDFAVGVTSITVKFGNQEATITGITVEEAEP